MKNVEILRKFVERDRLFQFRFDDKLQTIKYMRGDLADASSREPKALQAAARNFLRQNAALFGESSFENLDVKFEAADPKGGYDLTYRQLHGSTEVYGGSVHFCFDRNGKLTTVNNHLFPDLAKVPKQPRIKPEKAIAAAQAKVKGDGKLAENPQVLVYRHEGKPFLTWRVTIDDSKPGKDRTPALWVVFVNALDGKVLFFYNNIQTVHVVGSGTGYYSPAGNVNAWEVNPTTFQLRDTTRTLLIPAGPEIITNDEDGASPSEDADNNWNDTTAAPRHAHQGPEVDAHRYTGAVADYFRIVHGRNSFDGGGANMRTTVHYSNNYNNGFWHPTDQFVRLGDGTGAAATGDDYETTDDWLAHEFTHGFTQFTCGLQYLNESGALNEAFSDIFAAFITGDWLVFEDSWLKASAPASRNMADPTNGGLWDPLNAIPSVLAGHQPSHYSVRYTGALDNGGVHINSGIINNLFYLLTVGGTHTVSGITVTGIGQAAAEQMLWRCMTVNLVGNPTATFLDFREAMLDACLTLFPTDLVKLTQIKSAFLAVGIGPDIYVRDNLADTGLEPYPSATLYESPDVINRQAMVASPAVALANPGDGSLWENIEFGQNNFVYVRLQNRGSADGDAVINVYLIPLTSFGAPAGWIPIGTLIEVGIAPATLRVSGPLTLPKALIPAVGHYCMLAIASDGLDPAPDHNLITSVSDYIFYVRNTNNMAYRNMDVVDLLPDMAGVFELTVGHLGKARETYGLQLDIAKFVPGGKIRIRGPRKELDGAIPRGLRLVERGPRENVYALLEGKDLGKQNRFENRKIENGRIYGFDNLVLEKSFKLKVEYVLPDAETIKKMDKRLIREDFQFVVRQFYKDAAVGGAGLIFRQGKGQLAPKLKKARNKGK